MFPARFGGLSLGKVSRWMDTQGETIVYGELVCVLWLGNGEVPSPPMDAVEKNPASRYFDLQVSQVTCIWFGLSKIYANLYVDVCSRHKGCGKLLHKMVQSWQKFYVDGHIRYRERKDIMMTGVQNIVTSKHATYLGWGVTGLNRPDRR